MVTETIKELSARNPGLVFVEQKSFGYVEDNYGIRIPPTLRDRKFDYTVINKGKATDIEVNFYNGPGSTPSEIISSYINRGEVLSSAGWKFVWLTDGMGWKKMKNPLRVGIENIDYVVNAYFLRHGLIEKIIV